jgi:hypothetical protein
MVESLVRGKDSQRILNETPWDVLKIDKLKNAKNIHHNENILTLIYYLVQSKHLCHEFQQKYIHTYHSRFIPERVAEVSQIFLRDTLVLPKLVSYEEHCRRDR